MILFYPSCDFFVLDVHDLVRAIIIIHIMEDTAELESYVNQILQLSNVALQNKDPFTKARTLRNMASQIYAEAQETNDEKFACLLLRQHLDAYQESVIDPDSVNNYCDEVMKLLDNQRDFDEEEDDASVITESTLDDPLSYLVDKRTCKGRYEDCSSWESGDLKLSIEIGGATLSPQPVCGNMVKTDPFKTEPFMEKPTVLPGISRIESTTVEAISRRIFAPRTTCFAPIMQTTSDAVPNTVSGTEQEKNWSDGPTANSFRTAKDELQIQNIKKYGNSNPPGKAPLFAYGKKSLGGRRTLGGRFVCPIRNDGSEESKRSVSSPVSSSHSQEDSQDEEIDERLRHIDPKMVELIRSEIMDRFTPLTWDDIAGLEYAKTIIQEAVVWPILRPDIFTGLRKPPRGILLFGPPGTGKTLIGKCIASQSHSTFFSISASSLTSKWIGDGEKMVRALFAVAVVHQPAVVFIDEIDSLLCQRSETEHESSRRLKTEFLIQLDGAATAEDERILIVGATNRPQELDEAARRRLVKRLYIPLPELSARTQILTRLMASEGNLLTAEDIAEIGQITEGFSGADMKVLCHEASMGPIRSIPFDQLGQIEKDKVRPVSYDDFKSALGRVRASVSQNDLTQYVKWDSLYGSGASC